MWNKLNGEDVKLPENNREVILIHHSRSYISSARYAEFENDSFFISSVDRMEPIAIKCSINKVQSIFDYWAYAPNEDL